MTSSVSIPAWLGLPDRAYEAAKKPVGKVEEGESRAADVPSLSQELPMQTGPSLVTLLEQHSPSVEPRGHRKQRPQVEKQGLLFSLQ